MVSTQTKRKKTADMPDSPPKRVTRARAAKVTDDAPSKPKTTKITTASAKAAVEKKKSTQPVKAMIPPAKPTKRKTRADDDRGEAVDQPAVEELPAEEPLPEEQTETKPAKSKGRPKKPVVPHQEEARAVNPIKTRGRRAKIAVATNSTKSEVPKTRSRAKKVVETVPGITERETQLDETAPEPVKKTSRGRPAATTTKPPVTGTISRLAAAQPKKRVKFEEGPDKENVPVQTDALKKPAMKPTGLNAKPVRKPAVARATTRAKNVTQAPPTAKGKETNETMPLSPKKVIQVAKSDPISEDELSGEKTPTRALSKSPTKRPTSPTKVVDGVSKLNFDQRMGPPSPTKFVPSSGLTSPARRPPQSAFKNALKTSPKKLDFGETLNQPVLLSSRTPMKASLLQESPKRGVLADSAMKPVLLAPKSSFKASLLQSPARRPMGSPTKKSDRSSPEKFLMTPMDSDVTQSPSRDSPPKGLAVLPQEAASSPFRAVRSPERHVKVHTITDDELMAETMKHNSSQLDSPSPERRKEILVETSRSPQHSDAVACASPSSEDHLSMTQPASDVDEEISPDGRNKSEASAFPMAPVFSIGSASLRRVSMESESSEDELASPHKLYELTPLRGHDVSTEDSFTPAVVGYQVVPDSSEINVSFTPLADQLSSWKASSPDKRDQSRRTRGMFSIGGSDVNIVAEPPTPGTANGSPTKSSFFEDQMAMRDDQDVSCLGMAEGIEDELAVLGVSQESQASEEYGDENAIPTDPDFPRSEHEADQTLTCTPAKVFTPARVVLRPQEMHTVSKVPLRPSAEETPLQVNRQRSRSCGGGLFTTNKSRVGQADNVILVEQPLTPVLAPYFAPQTPSSGMRLDAETLGRTVRKGTLPDVLKGAVVYVDVHTTEGADASGIFVDLLTQMGARCVKQWNWNPRTATIGSLGSPASSSEGSPDVAATKIGITHVVYKDGGKRTLEKVRSSNGVVQCVGVGWVLDCEREDTWLEEADYAVDISVVPRGGSRRRKSMEPRALANLNGNLVPASNNETPAKPAEMSPTKEFLTFDTPDSRRETFVIDPARTHITTDATIPATPVTPVTTGMDDDILEDGSAWGSPTTPYYLSKGAKLVQQTCPSKQMGPMALFPVSGNVEDQPDETVRRRLLEARRKSLQWSSRIRSPLGRTVSYGK